MEMDKNVLSRIKEILKGNPRGMNVTEIVSEIRMNRQSVSKYLEMLVMSGHVDVRNFGPSKVYYLSQRVPVSAMLSLSYSFIIILDKMLNVINVNDHFLEFADVKREDMLYKSIEKFAFPIEFEPSIMPEVRAALEGKESSIEAFYKKKGSESYYNVRFIPMVMDDGEKGVAIFFEDITGKKKIEKAIRDSEFKFRSIIEQTLNGIVLIDQHGKIIEFNPALEYITGLKRDDVMGREIWDINLIDPYYSEDNTKLKKRKQQIQAYLKTGKSSVDRSILERKIIRPDGKVREVQVILFSIKTDGGHMLCLVYKDITKGKKMERELKKAHDELEARVRDRTAELEESRRTLTTLISNLPGIAYRCKNDDYWTISFISGGCMEITGYRPEDLVGNNRISYEEVVHPDDRDTIRRQIQSAIERKEQFNITYRIVTASGSIRRVNEQGRAVFSQDGNLVDVEGYISDITDLADMKFSRDQSEEKYRTLVENISDGIWELDSDLKFVYMSPRIYDILGFRPEDAIGKTPYDLMLPEEGERMKQALTPTRETPKPFSFLKCFLRHKNGSRVMVDISGTPFFNERHELQGYRGITRKIASQSS